MVTTRGQQSNHGSFLEKGHTDIGLIFLWCINQVCSMTEHVFKCAGPTWAERRPRSHWNHRLQWKHSGGFTGQTSHFFTQLFSLIVVASKTPASARLDGKVKLNKLLSNEQFTLCHVVDCFIKYMLHCNSVSTELHSYFHCRKICCCS